MLHIIILVFLHPTPRSHSHLHAVCNMHLPTSPESHTVSPYHHAHVANSTYSVHANLTCVRYSIGHCHIYDIYISNICCIYVVSPTYPTTYIIYMSHSFSIAGVLCQRCARNTKAIWPPKSDNRQ